MPGLDPGILFLATKKDTRDKPAYDEGGSTACAYSPFAFLVETISLSI